MYNTSENYLINEIKYWSECRIYIIFTVVSQNRFKPIVSCFDRQPGNTRHIITFQWQEKELQPMSSEGGSVIGIEDMTIKCSVYVLADT